MTPSCALTSVHEDFDGHTQSNFKSAEVLDIFDERPSVLFITSSTLDRILMLLSYLETHLCLAAPQLACPSLEIPSSSLNLAPSDSYTSALADAQTVRV